MPDDDETHRQAAARDDVVSGGVESYPIYGIEHRLPSAVLSTILSKLDPRSICSAAATCRSLRSCASHAVSFLPSFHLTEISPTLDLLLPLLPLNNQYLRSLDLDCGSLDDSSVVHLTRSSLHDLSLQNCENLSGLIFNKVGSNCPDLRSLSLSSLAERRGRSILFSDLEVLLFGCPHLEALHLAFDISGFHDPKFAEVWAIASDKLASLEIGYVPAIMLNELLDSIVHSRQQPFHVKPPTFPSLQKLCLSIDYITDYVVGSISRGLPSLTHLDLQDAPTVEPIASNDLTNSGLQEINLNGKLRHISLTRSHEFFFAYFRRVNDLGVLLMSVTCSTLESIALSGFCRVTDTGFRAIIHSCASLRQLSISRGSQLTDLVFHDISATALSLTHVSLRWCNLLTYLGIVRLSFNTNLVSLDLTDCRSLGDETLKYVCSLPALQTLLMDGTNVSDLGLSYLAKGKCPLSTLSLRGCKRLTDECIRSIFFGSFGSILRILDLSKVLNLSDDAVLMLAKSRVAIVDLRMRECPHIGDVSIMVLASMQVEGGSHGSSLRFLDLYECGGITPLAFRWFKRPYFPRLRWLGVTGSLNRDMVDALARNRPFLHVACRGEELGAGGCRDASNGGDRFEEDEIDELERWILEGENMEDYEGMMED